MNTPSICEINLSNEFLSFNDDLNREDAEAYSDNLCKVIEKLCDKNCRIPGNFADKITIDGDPSNYLSDSDARHVIKFVNIGPVRWNGLRRSNTDHSYARAHSGKVPAVVNDLLYKAMTIIENEVFERIVRSIVADKPGVMFVEAQVSGNSGNLSCEKTGLIILEAVEYRKLLLDYDKLQDTMTLNEIVNAISYIDEATIEIFVDCNDPTIALNVLELVTTLGAFDDLQAIPRRHNK